MIFMNLHNQQNCIVTCVLYSVHKHSSIPHSVVNNLLNMHTWWPNPSMVTSMASQNLWSNLWPWLNGKKLKVVLPLWLLWPSYQLARSNHLSLEHRVIFKVLAIHSATAEVVRVQSSHRLGAYMSWMARQAPQCHIHLWSKINGQFTYLLHIQRSLMIACSVKCVVTASWGTSSTHVLHG